MEELRKAAVTQDRLLKSSSSLDNEMKGRLASAEAKVADYEKRLAKDEGTPSSSADGTSADGTDGGGGVIAQLRSELKEVKQHGSFYFDENLQLHNDNDAMKQQEIEDAKEIESLKQKNELLKTEAEHERQVARKSQESVYTAFATSGGAGMAGMGALGLDGATNTKGHFSALSPTFQKALVDFEDDDDEASKKKLKKSPGAEVKDIMAKAGAAVSVSAKKGVEKTTATSATASAAKPKTAVAKANKANKAKTAPVEKTSGKAALVKSTSTHRVKVVKSPKNVLELVSASRKMFREIQQRRAAH